MRKAIPIALLLLAAAVARAQTGEFAEEPLVKEGEGPVRKVPSLFHRPARESPAAQMEYARALEAAGRLRKATRHYLAVVHAWHGAPEAVEAQKAAADLLQRRGKYRQAFDEYQYLIRFFPGRFDYAQIVDQQLRIANHVMTARHGRLFFLPGWTSPEEALPLLESVVGNAPDWERAPEAQYLIGWIHEQAGDREEAVDAYARVRYRYPNSEFAAAAGMRRGLCLAALSDRQPRDEETLREALSALSAYLRDYPGDAGAEAAEPLRDQLKQRWAAMHYERARFYDRIAKRPTAAVIAYRDFLKRFPYAEQADEAGERIRVLQAQVDSSHEQAR
jgi:outer membrane protein assembly factor BamD (BamD/ComL family)